MPDGFKEFYLNNDITKIVIPQSIKKTVKSDHYDKLLFVKTFRPDKMVKQVQQFVLKTIGEYYVSIPN